MIVPLTEDLYGVIEREMGFGVILPKPGFTSAFHCLLNGSM